MSEPRISLVGWMTQQMNRTISGMRCRLSGVERYWSGGTRGKVDTIKNGNLGSWQKWPSSTSHPNLLLKPILITSLLTELHLCTFTSTCTYTICIEVEKLWSHDQSGDSSKTHPNGHVTLLPCIQTFCNMKFNLISALVTTRPATNLLEVRRQSNCGTP